MNSDAFQWDNAKAAANYAKHGVTFEAARDVFKDPFAIEQLDDRQDYGEERWTILGTGTTPRYHKGGALKTRLLAKRNTPKNGRQINELQALSIFSRFPLPKRAPSPAILKFEIICRRSRRKTDFCWWPTR